MAETLVSSLSVVTGEDDDLDMGEFNISLQR